MRLQLSFKPDTEKRRSHRPSKSELIELSLAAQGIAALVEATTFYMSNHPDRDDQTKQAQIGIPTLNVLSWLIEPIHDYLSEHAGKSATEEPDTDA